MKLGGSLDNIPPIIENNWGSLGDDPQNQALINKTGMLVQQYRLIYIEKILFSNYLGNMSRFKCYYFLFMWISQNFFEAKYNHIHFPT
jgi:hypothetical protein